MNSWGQSHVTGTVPPGVWGNVSKVTSTLYVTKGDYHLDAMCRLRNGGIVDESWMRTAVDLDGKPRVNGRSVDPGCYEMDPAGLLLLVR